MIQAESRGQIYIPKDERYARVEAIESKIANLRIRTDHPRIFVNAEILPTLKAKVGQVAYNNVIRKADRGDYMNAAMAYLLTDDVKYAGVVYNYIIGKTFVKWTEAGPEPNNVFPHQDVACACLAFDWAYHGFTDVQRLELLVKLTDVAEISKRYQEVLAGYRKNGETFHREEWCFDASDFWCELALANHIPEANAYYQTKWDYDWYWGDALRMVHYQQDGCPLGDGYFRGNDGVGYFEALRTATGIETPWIRNAPYHFLYHLDMDNQREIFHHGVCGAANINSFNLVISDLWKTRAYLGQNFGLIATDPYAKWVLDATNLKPHSWIMNNRYYSSTTKADLSDIAILLYYDETVQAKSIHELPPCRYFPDGNELYLGTGWTGTDTRAFFRATPAYTKSSHGDYDTNSWGIYKNGQMLSGDTGFYDAYEGQTHYFAYQKNTVAHNDILFIDPTKPDEPRKSSGRADPGGTERISKRSFSSPNHFTTATNLQSVFVHATPTADWADITFYEERPEYVYAVGSAHKAYGDRTTKYNRHFMWIPEGQNAWVVVYDDLAYKSGLLTKDLIHSVTRPVADSREVVSEEVHDHIYTLATNRFASTTLDGSALMTTTVLLPKNAKVRFVGGTGYEYWVDGTKPQNFPIVTTLTNVEKWSGLPWQNMGTWRAEILGDGGNFFKVIYVCNAGDTVPAVQLEESGGVIGATFATHKVVFNGERLVLDNIVPVPIPVLPPTEPPRHEDVPPIVLPPVDTFIPITVVDVEIGGNGQPEFVPSPIPSSDVQLEHLLDIVNRFVVELWNFFKGLK